MKRLQNRSASFTRVGDATIFQYREAFPVVRLIKLVVFLCILIKKHLMAITASITYTKINLSNVCCIFKKNQNKKHRTSSNPAAMASPSPPAAQSLTGHARASPASSSSAFPPFPHSSSIQIHTPPRHSCLEHPHPRRPYLPPCAPRRRR